jgi:hypothetical protein
MKNVKMFLLMTTLCLFGFGMTSCGNSGKKADSAKQGKEYTSAYICPMHCEGSGSENSGKCPVCGMDYVVNEDYEPGDHKGEDHDGHDHDGHSH